MWPKHGGLAVLVAVASGCGGDDGGNPDAAIDAGPTAADFDGTWLMTSLTVATPSGPVTLGRDGTPQGVRGDVVFGATGPAAATLSVRQAILADGLLGGEVDWFTVDVALEAGRWLLTDPDDEVLVFTTEVTGDHLVLTLDPTDPRLTATDPPSRIVLDRVTPWSTTTVGAWDLVSITLPAMGTVTAGTCTAAGGGGAKIAMVVTFSERLLFQRVMTTTVYADAQCTTQTQLQTSTQTGYAEEEGDALLRMWGYENGEGEYQRFTMARAADVVTLTRTDCLPQPACATEAPTAVVVRRR